MKRGNSARFALEARQTLRIARHFLRQHLKGYVASELRIGRSIHLAHAARADRSGNPVVPEGSTDCGRGISQERRMLRPAHQSRQSRNLSPIGAGERTTKRSSAYPVVSTNSQSGYCQAPVGVQPSRLRRVFLRIWSACARFQSRAAFETPPSGSSGDCVEIRIHPGKPGVDHGSRRGEFRRATAGGCQLLGPPT